MWLEGEASAELQAIAMTARHRLERGIWTSPGAGVAYGWVGLGEPSMEPLSLHSDRGAWTTPGKSASY